MSFKPDPVEKVVTRLVLILLAAVFAVGAVAIAASAIYGIGADPVNKWW